MMMMMTLWQTDRNWFEVSLGDRWVGRVWANTQGEWTAQDWDGDTEAGFQTMLDAAFWVRDMRAALA